MYNQESFLNTINIKPTVVSCLLVGLSLISFIPIWTHLGFCPNFFVMVLYLWLIYRPDLIQFWGLMVVGLSQDGLYGYPLGVSILGILQLIFFAKIFRKLILQKSFGFVFCGYIAYLLVYSITQWGILSFFKQEWLPVFPILNFIGFSILTYPVVCQISLSLQKYIDRH